MSEKRPFQRTPNPPVEKASTVLVERGADLYRSDVVNYGRAGLAAHDGLKAAILERSGGAGCTLLSSGLQACATALFALTKAGDHILVTDSVYIPTRRFCDQILARFGVETEYYEPRIGAGIAELIRPNTAVVYLESPGSLTLEVQDVPAIAAAARAAGVLSVIDDTWAAYARMKAFALGVDVTVHSATKYPSGGSDVFLGAIVSRTPELAARIETQSRLMGASVSAEDAYLVSRSLHTLEARLDRHEASALAIADWLAGRPEVARVLHPARADHPDHALWARDFTGSSGLFSALLKANSTAQAHAFLDALELFGLGFSYGGFESLALWCDPQIKRNHADWSKEGSLFRFSIGLEPVEALIADLERGLATLKDA
jgi:cystathionine beta-lyase